MQAITEINNTVGLLILLITMTKALAIQWTMFYTTKTKNGIPMFGINQKFQHN